MVRVISHPHTQWSHRSSAILASRMPGDTIVLVAKQCPCKRMITGSVKSSWARKRWSLLLSASNLLKYVKLWLSLCWGPWMWLLMSLVGQPWKCVLAGSSGPQSQVWLVFYAYAHIFQGVAAIRCCRPSLCCVWKLVICNAQQEWPSCIFLCCSAKFDGRAPSSCLQVIAVLRIFLFCDASKLLLIHSLISPYSY